MRRVVFRGCRAKGVGSTETLTLDFAAYLNHTTFNAFYECSINPGPMLRFSFYYNP